MRSEAGLVRESERKRRWAREHPEWRRAYMAKWSAEHPGYFRENVKAWQTANRERMREYWRAYRKRKRIASANEYLQNLGELIKEHWEWKANRKSSTRAV